METVEWAQSCPESTVAKPPLVDFTNQTTGIYHNARAASRPGNANDFEAQPETSLALLFISVWSRQLQKGNKT